MRKAELMVVRRRVVLQAGGALFLGGCAESVAGPPPGAPPARSERQPKRDLAKAEADVREVAARIGGRFGLHAIDTANDNHVSIDADARFAMASTFKALLAGAILARIDAGQLSFDQMLPISQADLVEHAPVLEGRLAAKDQQLTIRDLTAAIMEVSDNGAANVLLRQVDGPAGLTSFLRGIGDSVTRLDRNEPGLNENTIGDERDTTTPRAMVESVRRLGLGEVLQPGSRTQLLKWMVDCQTGKKRIRGGLPDGWQAGDKTGTGMRLAVNDVAVIWPPGAKPLVMAIYTSDAKAKFAEVEQAHAEAAGIVARALI